MTELEGIAEDFPRRVLGATKSADSAAPVATSVASHIGDPAVETTDADASQVEASMSEGLPVEDASQIEGSALEVEAVESVETSAEISTPEPTPDEPAPAEIAVEAPAPEPTDALPRVLDPESRDVEDARALQTTLDGEAQRSFVARAQVLGANAWRAVDLGSGLGDIALAMARALPGLHLIAIESSAALLRLACRKRGLLNTNVAFVRGDARATGLPAHSCDLVLAHGLVHHLTDPLALFKEVARVASDGAAIYVRDLRRPETAEALERAVEDQASEWSGRQRRQFQAAMHAALRVDEVRALCDAAGLTGVEVRACGEHHWEVVRARRL